MASDDDDMITLPNGNKVRNATECGNCGATGDGLKKCNKCHAEAYCSRECQVAHWKQHKFMCKLSSKLNSAGNEMEALHAIYSLKQKQSDKNPNQSMGSLMFTHAGPVSTFDSRMPPGVPDNFLYIREAVGKFLSLKEGKREFGEAVYKKLLDELIENRNEWGDFFNFPANQTHAGDACMALEELASIYDGREDYENCEKVLDIMDFLLIFVKKHNNGSAQYDLSNFIVKNEYRVLHHRYDMNAALNRYEQNVSVLKKGVAFEEMHQTNIPKLMYPFKTTWKNMADCWNVTGMKPKVNAKRIDKVSDDTLLQILESLDKLKRVMIEKNPKMCREIEKESNQKVADHFGVSVEEVQNSGSKMNLKHCANCKKMESVLGEFKRCIQCKTVVYCGRDCQKEHWKAGHKKACVKK